MTLAELERAIASYKRKKKIEAQEKASYDYILGDLIGRSVGRIYSSSTKYPEIYEVYPTLFDNQKAIEQRQERQNELSALRFKQFAESFNRKFKKEGNQN